MNTLSIKPCCTADHDRLDGLFEQFCCFKHDDLDAARQGFEEFRRGLQRHIPCEEDLLFPLFEEKTGQQELGPTLVLRTEHRRIQQLLDAITHKLRRGGIGGEEEERALCDLLIAHNAQEGHLFYPALDQIMDYVERARVFDEVQKLISPDAVGENAMAARVGATGDWFEAEQESATDAARIDGPGLKYLPVVDVFRCTGCGGCVDACGPKCLEIVNGIAVLVGPDQCGSESHCIEPCPEDAICMHWMEGGGNQSVGQWRPKPGRVDSEANL